MNLRRENHLLTATMLAGSLAVARGVRAQGTFQILDFEAAFPAFQTGSAGICPLTNDKRKAALILEPG